MSEKKKPADIDEAIENFESALAWAEAECELLQNTLKPKKKAERITEYVLSAFEEVLTPDEDLSNHVHCIERLIKGLPLTAVDEENADWEDISSDMPDAKDNTKMKVYQSCRQPSLFKEEIDGEVLYRDVDRFKLYDVETGETFLSEPIMRIIDEVYPIELPYYASAEPMSVRCHCFTFNQQNKSNEVDIVDTVGIYSIIDGCEVISLGILLAIDSETGMMQPITMEEYLERYKASHDDLMVEQDYYACLSRHIDELNTASDVENFVAEGELG